jgi:hypothetical protein
MTTSAVAFVCAEGGCTLINEPDLRRVESIPHDHHYYVDFHNLTPTETSRHKASSTGLSITWPIFPWISPLALVMRHTVCCCYPPRGGSRGAGAHDVVAAITKVCGSGSLLLFNRLAPPSSMTRQSAAPPALCPTKSLFDDLGMVESVIPFQRVGFL